MDEIKFIAWPKTPRLFKDMIVTEKLDGTNGAVIVTEDGRVGAQSRNRLLALGPTKFSEGLDDWKKRDNQGFAQWVAENAEALAATLGPGHHYGEWYGQKIARKYGLDHRRFALFNVGRYGPMDLSSVEHLETVPVLYQGSFDTYDALEIYDELMATGSRAVPGFMNPEGIVVYHAAAKQVFKITDNGDQPKWQLQAVAA